MMKRILCQSVLLSCFMLFSFQSFLFAQNPPTNGSISLTTYYPAPFGAYDTLRLVPRDEPVCDENAAGTLYTDADGNLYYCRNEGTSVSPVWVWGFADQLWLRSGNNMYPSDISRNVGIGTKTPKFPLHVEGVGRMMELRTINVGETWIGHSAAGGYVQDSTVGSPLRFYVSKTAMGDTEAMRITSLGSLGIGTTEPHPSALVDIKGFGNNETTYGLGIRNSDNNYSLVVTDDGNVGIGVVSPTAALEIGGLTKATGGLVIETRTTDPMGALPGQMWLRTDVP